MASHIAKEIRLARKSLKMNQAQFAEALNASQGSVSKWESGREVPRLEALEKIAELAPSFRFADGPEDSEQRHRPPRPPAETQAIIVNVPILGAFSDGYIPSRYDHSEGHVSFPLTEEWKGRKLEAYFYEPRERSGLTREPDVFLLIFAILSEHERVDDIGPHERLLLAKEGSNGEGWWIVEFEPWQGKIEPFAGALWPVNRRARRRLLPIPIDEDGKLTAGGTRLVGLQLCALAYTSRTAPTRLEPLEPAERER